MFKISFGEVYRWIYSWKSRFTTPFRRHCKTKFPTYIQCYTSPNETFEYSYPLSHKLKPNRFAINKKVMFSQDTVPFIMFMSYFLEYLFIIDVFEQYLCVNDLISCTCSPELVKVNAVSPELLSLYEEFNSFSLSVHPLLHNNTF